MEDTQEAGSYYSGSSESYSVSSSSGSSSEHSSEWYDRKIRDYKNDLSRNQRIRKELKKYFYNHKITSEAYYDKARDYGYKFKSDFKFTR